MKVMVTGATGFVGSHTAKALKQAGHQVRLLVRSKEKAEAVCQGLDFAVDEIVLGDITDEQAVKAAVEGCDAVVHSAAMVATAEKYADAVWKTNVEGTRLVIDASLAAGVDKIIYVSSISALFTPNLAAIDENSPISEAKSPYGRSKTACEHYIRKLQADGAPIVCTYPAGVVGSHDPGLSEPHFGLRMFLGQFTFTSSTGVQFINVKDIARAHTQILESMQGPDRFVLGGYFYPWQELLSLSRKLTGRRLPAVHIPGPALRLMGAIADQFLNVTGVELPVTGEGMMYASQWVEVDSSKIEKELSFQFSSKEETLSEVYRWLYQTGELSKRKVGLLAEAL